MSSEIENTKDDIKEQIRPFYMILLDFWQIGVKILELILCAACMGFAYDPVQVTGLGKSQLHHVGVMYTAFTGYMLINGVLLLTRAFGDKIPYRLSAIFSLAGCAMFLVTGILLIADKSSLTKQYNYQPSMYLLHMLTTSIIFAFVNAAVFMVDAIITFKKKEDM